MRTFLPWLGALLVAGVAAAVAHADPYYWQYQPQAPTTCGPGFAGANPYGMIFGASFGPQLPPEPFGGIRPNMPFNMGCNGNRGCQLWFRSPRDFFMLDDP